MWPCKHFVCSIFFIAWPEIACHCLHVTTAFQGNTTVRLPCSTSENGKHRKSCHNVLSMWYGMWWNRQEVMSDDIMVLLNGWWSCAAWMIIFLIPVHSCFKRSHSFPETSLTALGLSHLVLTTPSPRSILKRVSSCLLRKDCYVSNIRGASVHWSFKNSEKQIVYLKCKISWLSRNTSVVSTGYPYVTWFETELGLFLWVALEGKDMAGSTGGGCLYCLGSYRTIHVTY